MHDFRFTFTAGVQLVSEYWPLESLDAEQRQNMLSALRDNDLVSLEKCLQRPQDPEIGYLEAALLLLEAKAKIDQLDFSGGTPLWIAAELGNVDIVHRLVEAGAFKNQEATHFDGATPLIVAACKGHLEMVRFLVEVGAVKYYGNEDGRSNSIVHCSWHSTGYLEIVTFLVEAGAAKDQAANDGATPLFAAAQEGQLETVRFLVEVGAATDQATKDGSTPLLIAAKEGHLNIVRLLVQMPIVMQRQRSNGFGFGFTSRQSPNDSLSDEALGKFPGQQSPLKRDRLSACVLFCKNAIATFYLRPASI